MPVLAVFRLVGASLIAGGVFWLVDEIGDRREKKVRAEYAEALRAKNVEIGDYNSAADAVDAAVEAAVQTAVQNALSVPGGAKATPAQADAINAIRRAAR